MSEENKAVVRRWLEDGMNGRDLAIIDELFAPDYANHSPRLGVVGREYTARETAEFFKASQTGRLPLTTSSPKGKKSWCDGPCKAPTKVKSRAPLCPQPGNWSLSQYGRCFASLMGR